MTNINEILRGFSSYTLHLEKGPVWSDEGWGEIAQVFDQGEAAMVEVEEAAQALANEVKHKVVLVVSGKHQKEGEKRVVAASFYPQITTETRSPESYYLEVRSETLFCQANISLDEAWKQLNQKVSAATTTFYVWRGGLKTRSLVPEPPEGHYLMILRVQPNTRDRNWKGIEEYFLAVRKGKIPNFNGRYSVVGEFVEFTGEANEIKIPEGSYIHNGVCWTVIDSTMWWIVRK